MQFKIKQTIEGNIGGGKQQGENRPLEMTVEPQLFGDFTEI